MRAYQETLQATNQWENPEKVTVWDMIGSFFSSFSKTVTLDIMVPKNVYIRAQLVCEYISEKVDINFEISDFLTTLYLDFLQTSIEHYNPKRIHDEINRSHGYTDVLLIHAQDTVFTYKKKDGKQTILSLSFDKGYARKGELLLEEMEDLYGQAPSLEQLLSTLFLNFIEDYKAGNNQKALNQIIRMLKKQKKEQEE